MKAISETRERIIDTATRLFYEQGYNLTGINQVIGEADVAKASLYQHFASKEDLLLEYLRRSSEAWFRDLETFSRGAKTPREKILKIFDFRRKKALDSQYAGCNFVKISAEVPRDHARVFKVVAAHKEALRQYMRTLVREMEGRKTKAGERKADTLFLLMEGASVSATFYQDGWAHTTVRKLVEDLL